MDIGKRIRRYTTEPIEEPVPRETPAPQEKPVEAPPTPEKVPA